MIYKVTTNTPLAQVKEEIEIYASKRGFGLLKTYPFKEILRQRGHPIEKDITVYELCNPAGAQQALGQVPELSAYLPCRVSVYEEDGVRVLATIGLENIVDALHIDPPFQSYMIDLFEQLKQVMHSWD